MIVVVVMVPIVAEPLNWSRDASCGEAYPKRSIYILKLKRWEYSLRQWAVFSCVLGNRMELLLYTRLVKVKTRGQRHWNVGSTMFPFTGTWYRNEVSTRQFSRVQRQPVISFLPLKPKTDIIVKLTEKQLRM